MKSKALHTLIFPTIFGLLFAVLVSSAFAQSQALNGQIEGSVIDQTGAAVAKTVITATNIETGATRIVSTDESGVYRFPLLPLGTYRISAEAANFKKFVREGITLTTGQTATIDIVLQTGDIKEVVTVSADASVADAGKTDFGRVINNREVQNLPIPQRNPYNLGRLQANVTGRPLRAFNNANLNVNGYLQRVNYLLDGNWSTQADRPGVRLLFISETYVNEVQLVTNGFAAEFGNTPGLIMNVVTPSGTNKLSGSAGVRFSRTPFYARPFFYSSPDDLPENNFTDLTATIGGAIIRDRWHFYGGFESVRRDDSASSGALVTIRPSDRAQLIAAGLPDSIFPASIPISTKRDFYIFRTDLQLNKSNRLTGRFNRSPHIALNLINGGLNTLERGVNNISPDYSFGVQLVSYKLRGILNELRFQYAQRIQKIQRNEFSGSLPSITITGVANFGASVGAVATINPLEKVTQIQNNLTRTLGTHVIKFGGGFTFIDDFKREAIVSRYTFSSISAYLAARNGTNSRSYARYEETFGNPEITYKSTFWNFFVQDDWKLTRRLKINMGLRYDLYLIPEADTSSLFPASQKFNVDKNNFAPRLGIVYALREGNRPTILRAGAGIYYETPWLNMFERALLKNGDPGFFNISFNGNNNGTTAPSANAPVFPDTFLGSLPSGSALPRQDIDTIAPDFETMYAIHSSIQLEQAITENLAFTIGFVHSAGRNLPVYRSINRINPISFLADGRPVFSTAISSATRLDPRFNNILMVESAGVSRYDALSLQLTQRFFRGLQFNANYTLSKAIDDAPDGNLEGLNLSDPTNRSLDKGNSTSDQRHTFVMSLVFQPKFNFSNKTLRYLFSNNQFGVIAVANSGERFNIVSGIDLNRDGISTSDRPIGIKRNEGKTPPQFNIDLRYSRFLNFTERYKLEVFGEFQNLFNINSIVQYNNVTVTTNPVTGELIGELPDFRARNQSTAQESRQFQLGVKFIF
jgi:hypothetical protein